MVLSYRGAGVDVPRIRGTQAAIGKLVASTHHLQRTAKVRHGFGHYAGVVEVPGGAAIATHTDGVGTKVLVAGAMKRYDTVGIDCIAMNVNDMVCIGATPVAFVDYIAASRNDGRIIGQIVKGLVAGAKKSRVPIVGGETAIMPDLMRGKGFAFDLAGTVTGYLDPKRAVLGGSVRPGDVIIGAKSTGLHSNGYSLARRALLRKYSVEDRVRGVGTVGSALLRPTRIYALPVLEMLARCEIHGLAHITGGSFTKLLRLKNIGYEIDDLPRLPPVMGLIAEQGVRDEEMYRTFNMGVGFCVIAPSDQSARIRSVFKRHGIPSQEIGRTVPGRGTVTVNSKRIA